jgi:hypothetical protein
VTAWSASRLRDLPVRELYQHCSPKKKRLCLGETIAFELDDADDLVEQDLAGL